MFQSLNRRSKTNEVTIRNVYDVGISALRNKLML